MREGSNKAAIIVMVKGPRSGEVKTRLMPELNPEEAAALAACFAQDVVRNMRALAATIFLAYTPAGGREILEPLLPQPDLYWIEQRGADLGERMNYALTDAAKYGFHPLIIVGTDSPHLPDECVTLALGALIAGQADVVLGPTEDGGYYLVGTHGPIASLFTDVPWSTSRVYEDTASNVSRLNRRLLRLPEWYDIDTPADFLRLCRQMRADPILKAHIPNTASWIDRRDIKIRLDRPL